MSPATPKTAVKRLYWNGQEHAHFTNDEIADLIAQHVGCPRPDMFDEGAAMAFAEMFAKRHNVGLNLIYCPAWNSGKWELAFSYEGRAQGHAMFARSLPVGIYSAALQMLGVYDTWKP